MKKTTLFILLFTKLCYGQTPIDVADLTLKVKANSTEEFLYGFAEGDQIVFSFSETEGRELKEVEVSEYPNNSKYLDYETAGVENKIITVLEKGVYRFRFRNSHILKGRVCHVEIQRIPAKEELKKFNTNIKWINKQDTAWNSYTKDYVVGYDTLLIQKSKKELEKEEVVEEVIMDKNQRVHSINNIYGNKTFVFFSLPLNIITDNEIKKVIGWAYWVGVGEESNKAWQENRKILSNSVKSVASLTLSPLGALLAGALTDLALPTIGEDVSYGLVDETNKNYFMSGLAYRGWDFGKGVAGYKKFTDEQMCQGKFFVVLSNDNQLNGIDVNIKISALIQKKIYKDVAYTEVQSKPIYEKRIVKDPIVTSQKIPVTFDYKL